MQHLSATNFTPVVMFYVQQANTLVLKKSRKKPKMIEGETFYKIVIIQWGHISYC